MTKRYEFNKSRNAISIVMERLRAHVDKWARYSKDGISYKINIKGKWEDRFLPYTEALRIAEDVWPR